MEKKILYIQFMLIFNNFKEVLNWPLDILRFFIFLFILFKLNSWTVIYLSSLVAENDWFQK